MKKILFFPMLLFAIATFAQGKYDIIIRNGKIVDGTGNPWYIGDIGIKKGSIRSVGDLSAAVAKQEIDARGLIVAPGFIDVHTHLDRSVLERPYAENFLYDGVTTVITGNCGSSNLDLRDFFKQLKKQGASLNVATFIGHNTVRREVMGSDNRPPTPAELAAMRALVDEVMREGAVGLSTGLEYTPGTFATTDEIAELARVAAAYGGVYTSHIRYEDHRVFDAVAEAVEVGRKANLPVEVSHFKVVGKGSWGDSQQMIEQISQYRAEGLDVTVDQYPYTASSTTLGLLVPNWAFAGGMDSLEIRLATPAIRAKIIADMKVMLQETGFDDYVFAVVANCSWQPDYNGKNLVEVNQSLGKASTVDNQIETILEMIPKGAQMIYHKMSEEDIQRIMQYPYTMIASDGGIQEFGSGAPHPRSYGTNARVLGRYVRELGILNLEDAIRKMTSLPALRFNLTDRGILREGMAADIVIFDENKIADKATFEASHAYSEGINYVLVNGKTVIANGRHLQRKPGQPLKNKYSK